MNDVLKLHMRAGQVWYIDGDKQPADAKTPVANSQATISEFMDNPMLLQAERVQLAGTHVNAELIVALFDAKCKERVRSVEVVTPLVCATERERSDPESILQRLPLVALAPSQGGFHELTEDDYHAYALAAEMARIPRIPNARMKLTEKALRLYKQHPAYRPLSWIRSLDPFYAAATVSSILDPRWFIDTAAPDRVTRLNAALGLDLYTQAAVTNGTRRRARHFKRCKDLLRMWKDPNVEREVRAAFRGAGVMALEDSDKPGIAPWDFTWRVWGHHIGYPSRDDGDLVKADLRASMRLLCFLYHTWLNELYRGSRAIPDGRLDLFRPADFFKNKAEVLAFDEHLVHMRKMYEGRVH